MAQDLELAVRIRAKEDVEGFARSRRELLSMSQAAKDAAARAGDLARQVRAFPGNSALAADFEKARAGARAAKDAAAAQALAVEGLRRGLRAQGVETDSLAAAYRRLKAAAQSASSAKPSSASSAASITPLNAPDNNDLSNSSTGRPRDAWAASIARVGHYGSTLLFGGAAVKLARDTLEANRQFTALENTLRQTSGSAQAAAKEYQFVAQEAGRLGVSLNTAASGYASLAAAAQGTALPARQVRELFSGLSEAGAVLGLSGEQMQGALLAVSQIMSKGVVSAEELRGQLGERLPGAFNIAAKAMGVNTAELSRMLDKGQLVAADFLPKFAAELRKTYAEALPEATRSAAAAFTRLDNTWEELKRQSASAIAQVAAAITGLDDSAAASARDGKVLAWAEGVATAFAVVADAAAVVKNTIQGVTVDIAYALDKARIANERIKTPARLPARAGGGTNPRLAALDRQEAAVDAARAASVPGADDYGVAQRQVAGLFAERRRLAALAPGAAEAEAFGQRIAGLVAQRAKGLAGAANEAARQAVLEEFKADAELAAALMTRAGAEQAARARGAAERAAAQAAAAAKSGRGGQAEAARAAQLEALRNTLDQRLARAGGDALQADLAGAVKGYEQALAQLKKLKGAAADNDLAASVFRQEVLRANLDDARRAWAQTLASMDRESERVNLLRDTGKITAEDARGQISALQRRTAGELAPLLDRQRALAANSPQDADAARRLEEAGRILKRLQGTAAQTGWLEGARSALASYASDAGDSFRNAQQAAQRAFQGMEDALVQFVRTGKFDFKSLADSILADLARIAVRQQITGPLASALGGGEGGGSGVFSFLKNLLPFAQGGVFDAPGLAAYRNTVVARPTLFKFASGGIMGEAGAEAIMPLRRGAGGRLGVDASGMGGGVSITINEAPGGDRARVSTRPRGDGGMDVLVDMVSGRLARDVSSGRGALTDALQSQFALNRVAGVA